MRDRAWLCAAITMLAAAFGAPAASADPIPQLPVPKPVYADAHVAEGRPREDERRRRAARRRRSPRRRRRQARHLPSAGHPTRSRRTTRRCSRRPRTLVRRGYVVMVADARGTGGSGGSWDSFGPREQDDTLELLAWARRQPWSNGDLAMTGPSYMAINQLLAAERRPAGLKAIFPIVPAGDVYRDVVWHGGQIDAGFMPFWIGLVAVLGLVPPSDSLSNPNSLLAWVQARVERWSRLPRELDLVGRDRRRGGLRRALLQDPLAARAHRPDQCADVHRRRLVGPVPAQRADDLRTPETPAGAKAAADGALVPRDPVPRRQRRPGGRVRTRPSRSTTSSSSGSTAG